MKRLAVIIIPTLVLLQPSTACAQLFGLAGESTRSQQVELKFGGYTPNIDSEAGVNAYEVIFEDESMFMTRFEYDYQVWQGFGSLAIGFEFGFGDVTGKGQEVVTEDEDEVTYAGKSSDESELTMMPFSIALVYHLDVLMTRWDIPFVPFVKLGLDYAIWWITDGVGETAEFEDADGNRSKASGDTVGWHVATGIKLCLDTFAPTMAKTLDNESGINNSYVFAEFLYADIDDFGSSESFRLGDSTVQFGVAFEF